MQALLDLQVPLVHLETKERQDPKDHVDLAEILDQLDKLDHKGPPALQVLRVRREFLVLLDL